MARLAAAGHEILGYDTVMPVFSVVQKSAALGCEMAWGDPEMMPGALSHPFAGDAPIRIPAGWMDPPSIRVVLDALSLLRRQYGDRVVIVGKAMGPWSLSYHMMGVEEFLISTITDPGRARRSLEALTEVTIAFARAQVHAGADNAQCLHNVQPMKGRNPMNRDTARQLVNVVATVLMIAVNILATTLPLNGQDTGAISDRFAIYFVPAGYVFSIWGLIYLAVIGFAVFQALPSQRENPRLRRVGYLYALTSVLNIVWLFLWHYNVFAGTLVVMLGLLASLIAVYLRLGIGVATVKTAEKWLVNVPFSIYLGWITVATIANASQLLFYLKWNGLGVNPQFWAVIMIGAATIVALLMALTRRDIAYLLVLVWALAGIGAKHLAAPAVTAAAWLATVLIVLMVIFLAVRSFRPRHLAAPG